MKLIDQVFSKLKSPTIRERKSPTMRERKPSLKLCSNHYKDDISKGRFWNSYQRGQAISDGKGWYR